MHENLPSRRLLLFVNPIAGRGRGLAAARFLTDALTAAGYTVDSPPGPPAMAAWSPEPPPAAALVIGGDGTLRAFVERILAVGECPPVLPIPMGTANLMGRHLGLRRTPRTLAATVLDILQRRKIIHLDAGRANDRLFLLMVGVGLDAEVVHLLDRVRKGPIDLTSYVIPTVRAFAHYTFPKLSAWIDGQLVLDDRPALAIVGNIPEYGTGIPILTRARPDDGLLDVCLMPCKNPFELAELLLALAMGAHTSREGVIYRQCRSARIESTLPVPAQFDGDVAGFTPLSIEVVPRCVPMLV